MGLKCHKAIIIFHIWSTPVYLRETKTLYNLEVRYIVQRCNMVRVGHAYNLRVTIFYANEWQILIARDLKFELYADLVHIQLWCMFAQAKYCCVFWLFCALCCLNRSWVNYLLQKSKDCCVPNVQVQPI